MGGTRNCVLGVLRIQLSIDCSCPTRWILSYLAESEYQLSPGYFIWSQTCGSNTGRNRDLCITTSTIATWSWLLGFSKELHARRQNMQRFVQSHSHLQACLWNSITHAGVHVAAKRAHQWLLYCRENKWAHPDYAQVLLAVALFMRRFRSIVSCFRALMAQHFPQQVTEKDGGSRGKHTPACNIELPQNTPAAALGGGVVRYRRRLLRSHHKTPTGSA